MAIQWSDRPNLVNRVVRACSALVSGDGLMLKGDVRCSVEHGQVNVQHLDPGDNLRNGRYMFGDAMTRGQQSAQQVCCAGLPPRALLNNSASPAGGGGGGLTPPV